jgi:type I restriction enzyme S subunit
MTGRNITDTQDHIAEGALTETATQAVPPGSVLVVVRSGILAHSVPIGIARVRLALNQDMKALIPVDRCISGEFLAYFLQSCSAELLAGYVKRGATVHSIDIGRLRQLPVPLPAWSEQRRIVDILDQASALRHKRAEADRKAERILPVIFYRVFGDPERNPRKWDVTSFYRLLNRPLRNGISPSATGTIARSVLTLSAITGPEFDARAQKQGMFTAPPDEGQLVSESDFLICRGNGNLQLVGRARFPSCSMPDTSFPDTIIAASIDQKTIARNFLETIWGTPFIRKQIESRARTTNGTHKINQPSVESISLPLPPRLLQQEFDGLAERVRTLRNQQADSDRRLTLLFKALLHRAFSGNLTAGWRQAHMEELLQEMEAQARAL